MSNIAGVRITRQGTSFPSEYMKKNIDPRNRSYFWYGCDMETSFEDPNIDEAVLLENYISITPIRCDMTDYGMIDELRKWEM